jgi:hypothetical protein
MVTLLSFIVALKPLPVRLKLVPGFPLFGTIVVKVGVEREE